MAVDPQKLVAALKLLENIDQVLADALAKALANMDLAPLRDVSKRLKKLQDSVGGVTVSDEAVRQLAAQVEQLAKQSKANTDALRQLTESAELQRLDRAVYEQQLLLNLDATAKQMAERFSQDDRIAELRREIADLGESIPAVAAIDIALQGHDKRRFVSPHSVSVAIGAAVEAMDRRVAELVSAVRSDLAAIAQRPSGEAVVATALGDITARMADIETSLSRVGEWVGAIQGATDTAAAAPTTE